MSNSLSIATVTATLQYLLQKELQTEARLQGTWIKDTDKDHVEPLEHVKVRVGRPRPAKLDENPLELNICLYQLTPNIAYRNADLPTYRHTGEHIQQKQLALDAHYIFSFYGDDQILEAERLMGAALFIMHKYPILTPELIKEAMRNSAYGFMQVTTLYEQIDHIKIVPTVLSLEELSKIWSIFFQVPYTLSFTYKASVVLIKGEDKIIEPLMPKKVSIDVIPKETGNRS